MKQLFNYIVCSLALMLVAVLISCNEFLWVLAGFLWGGALYLSGCAFPRFWAAFWVQNRKICRYFGCW